MLGGIGNLAGAMLGGMLLGVDRGARRRLHRRLSTVTRCRALRVDRTLFGSNYQDVFAFLVLILVLVFRPSGLLGERVGDRA